MIWMLLFAGMILLSAAGGAYLSARLAELPMFRKIQSKGRARLAAAALLIAGAVVLALTIGVWNMMVCILHLLAFWLLCDGAAFLLRKATGRKTKNRQLSGYAALVLTVAYLSFGWYTAHHVVATHYEIYSDKLQGVERLRVVGFADSHVGTTFHGEKMAQYVEKINAQKPDLVFIAGDFVDDDTSREDMLLSCEALGNLQTVYGVYYVLGNHDKGYYASGRGYTEADIIENLTRSGVTVLRDELAPITENISVLGRLDAQAYARAGMETLAQLYSEDDFVIVLDHEPNDYAAEQRAGAGLVISGHTHGGQLLPINRAGEWLHMNDRTYGYERRGDTQYLVTSGISDWAIKFKTGCKAEYLVVDILRMP